LLTPTAQRDILKTEEFLAADAEVLVVAYGITARAAKDAIVEARAAGIKAGLLRPITLWPSDRPTALKHLARAKRVIVAELNLGQYRLEIERLAYEAAQANQCAPSAVTGLNRVDTQLITPREIYEEICR
jgi:2-oxoglutarate ferredoxin oxidoreductase subunit alpha